MICRISVGVDGDDGIGTLKEMAEEKTFYQVLHKTWNISATLMVSMVYF